MDRNGSKSGYIFIKAVRKTISYFLQQKIDKIFPKINSK